MTKYNSMEFPFIQDSDCLYFSIICSQSLVKKILVLNYRMNSCFGDGSFMELFGKINTHPYYFGFLSYLKRS